MQINMTVEYIREYLHTFNINTDEISIHVYFCKTNLTLPKLSPASRGYSDRFAIFFNIFLGVRLMAYPNIGLTKHGESGR